MAAIAAVVLLAGREAARAQVSVGVEDWGLGGAVKGGMWTPLYVELTAKERDFTGAIVVTADAQQRVLPVFVKPIVLIADTRSRHWTYFRMPASTFRGSNAQFTWRLVDARGREVHRSRWSRAVVLPAYDHVVAVMRSEGAERAGIGGLTDGESETRTNVLYVSPAMAPDRAEGYEPADVLVWMNPDAASLGLAQADAIEAYVRQGGHLVISAGAGWQALRGSFLADLLPARPVGSVTVPDVPALRAYSEATLMREPATRLPSPAEAGLGGRGAGPMVLLRLEDVRGEVLMDHEGAPLMVRGPAGAGRVTLLAFDPTTSPFADLRGRALFWTAALDLQPIRKERHEIGRLYPVSDPLLRTLNDFPGFKPINFAFVAVFLLIYVGVIGPADYFILKHLKRLHWTWVTFPSVAVLSSVLAFALLSSGRVVGLWTNSVSIVDASAEGGELSGTTYMTMLSPKHARYDVSLEGVTGGDLVPREFSTVLPSGGLGWSRTECTVLGVGDRVEGLLVRIWDAQTFQAAWRCPAPQLPEVEARVGPGGLAGSITNTTGDSLRRTVVVFANRVVAVGDIAPGASKAIGAQSEPAASYARQLVSARDQGDGGWSPRERTAQRGNCDGYARWASLFGALPPAGTSGPGFRRLAASTDEYSNLVFDLPARLQLPDPGGSRQAVVIYGVARSFARLRLEGRTPKAWDWTVVRLRVPVAAAGQGDGS